MSHRGASLRTLALFAGVTLAAPAGAQFTLVPQGSDALRRLAPAPTRFREPTALIGVVIGPETRRVLLYDGSTQSVADFALGGVAGGLADSRGRRGICANREG